MHIQRYSEFELTDEHNRPVADLLSRSFPEIHFLGRTYYKQLPHFRLLAFSDRKIIGQVGVDYRVMSLGGTAIKVFGIIDLCVDEQFRRQGIASELLREAEDIATRGNADFMLLFSDIGKVYQKNGYRYVPTACTWLKIDQHESFGIGKKVQNEMMIKQIGNKVWKDGELDMLGYLY